MQKLNLILVYNNNQDKILMCKRKKEPYKGKLNLVGGKVEENEDELSAAYRELEEETGISKADIKLINIMNFTYCLEDFEMEIYYGILNKKCELIEEVNKLCWVDKSEDFFNIDKFAGEGNIYHIIKRVELYRKKHVL